jgi:hypothetical protein
LTLCWRIESERQAKSGAWIHGTAPLPYERRIAQRIAPTIAPIDRRHEVFMAFLKRLTLSDRHADQLSTVRGLSDAAIAQARFASVPSYKKAEALIAELSQSFDLAHVPGFYRKDEDWRLRFTGMAGFYIPLRDAQGRIEALQIRRDGADPKFRYCLVSTPPDEFPQGASSGAPPHFAGDVTSAQVIVTEGGLKATICASMLSVCVVGLVAVGTFRDSFGWRLRQDLPNAASIGIAYDRDAATNDKVAAQLKRLRASLELAGYEPVTLTWPADYKGLDDYLLTSGSRYDD